MIGKKCLKSLLVFGGIMSVFAFGKTALADEVPVVKGEDGKYDVSYLVESPEGITDMFALRNADFKVESKGEGVPAAKVDKVRVPAKMGRMVFDEKRRVWSFSAKTTISFGKFEHTGVYQYILSRSPSSHPNHVTASSLKYTLRVYVINAGKGPEIKAVTAEESGLKKGMINFQDIYFHTSSVSVAQHVSGDLADADKSFKYVLKATRSAYCAGGLEEAMKGSFSRKGSEEKEEFKIPYGDEYEFSLKSGESITVYLPAGSYVCVYKKCEKDGYVPRREEYSDSKSEKHELRIGEDKAYNFSLVSDDDSDVKKGVLVYDRGENIDVTDVATNDVPLTGLFLDEKSGVMMVAVAFGSLVALGAGAVVYKKKTSDR